MPHRLLRRRRLRLFERLCAGVPRPLRIIDVGGTYEHWRQLGWADRSDVRITTVNLAPEPKRSDAVDPRVGDATDLSEFDDDSFDIAFSNSVIEHLFTFENQRRMAVERGGADLIHLRAAQGSKM